MFPWGGIKGTKTGIRECLAIEKSITNDAGRLGQLIRREETQIAIIKIL